MKRIFFTTLLTTLLCFNSFAQSINKTKLDSYFEALDSNDRFMGNVAVAKDGEIIYSKAIGFSDRENQIRTTENSKYRIGSISKSFTSVLILKAIEEKKLKLNQTIKKFYPNIQNADKINIHHLLMHRSGIHNFTNDDDYLNWNTAYKTKEEMVEIITKVGSDFEPDSKAEYSNSNYVLLTYILEELYDKSYAELIRKYIVQPIGLTDTYVGGKINADENEANSYRFSGKWEISEETDMSVPAGAGNIVSSASDLTRFYDALFGGMLLNKKSLELMKTTKDGFAMGLFQFPFYDKIGYGHTGGIDGFSSVAIFFPEDKISYALVSNGANFNNNNISIAVLSSYYGKEFDIPEFSNYSITSEELDKYLGVYSSKEINLEITITKKDAVLIAQVTGQPSIPLEAIEKDKFSFEAAGVILEFPSENNMILNQFGMQFKLIKE